MMLDFYYVVYEYCANQFFLFYDSVKNWIACVALSLKFLKSIPRIKMSAMFIVQFVIVIAWCRVQYGIYFSSYFCFQILHEREARVQYENKNNEKNISHIARRFHAIISLSYGIFIMFWLFCIDVGRKNRVFDVRYISF